MTVGEVLQLDPLQEIVLVQGHPPIRGHKIDLYGTKALMDLVKPPPDPPWHDEPEEQVSHDVPGELLPDITVTSSQLSHRCTHDDRRHEVHAWLTPNASMIRFTPEVKEAVVAHAHAAGVSMNDVINAAIERSWRQGHVRQRRTPPQPWPGSRNSC